MLDAQQNGWNVGYDLAMALAVIGIGLSGDPVTTKMSIGCDATSRTAATGSLLGQELGIDAHNVYDPLHHADIVLRHPLFHFLLLTQRLPPIEIRSRHLLVPQ